MSIFNSSNQELTQKRLSDAALYGMLDRVTAGRQISLETALTPDTPSHSTLFHDATLKHSRHKDTNQRLGHLITCIDKKPTVQDMADAKDMWGNTPFHQAALSGCFNSLVTNLEDGDTVTMDQLQSIKTNIGATPLHFAAQGGFVSECLDSLVDGKKPTLDEWMAMRTQKKATPYHNAAKGRTFDKLISATKDNEKPTLQQMLDTQNESGQSIVHYAACYGSFSQLIKNVEGAEKPSMNQLLEAKDDKGLTPIDWAATHGDLGEVMSHYTAKEQNEMVAHVIQNAPKEQLYQRGPELLSVMDKTGTASTKNLSLFEENAPDWWQDRPSHGRLVADLKNKAVRKDELLKKASQLRNR